MKIAITVTGDEIDSFCEVPESLAMKLTDTEYYSQKYDKWFYLKDPCVVQYDKDSYITYYTCVK